MNWLILALAGGFEVAWAVALVHEINVSLHKLISVDEYRFVDGGIFERALHMFHVFRS